MSIKVSVLAAGSNQHQTSAEEVNGLATDLLTPGVVGTITNTSGVAPSAGSFAVNGSGTLSQIVVSAGKAYVAVTPSGQGAQTVRVSSDSDITVGIPLNATGAVRYDWVYIKLDQTLAANPNAAGDNVGTIYLSRSTSNTIDNGTPPAYGLLLGIVTVNANVSVIASGNITDKRRQTGIAPAVTTEANGWTVFDYGSFKEFRYEKRALIASWTNTSGFFPDLTVNLPAGYNGSQLYIHSLSYGNAQSAILKISYETSQLQASDTTIGGLFVRTGQMTNGVVWATYVLRTK